MTAYSKISDVPLFRYGFVMADPPWAHERWSDKGSERAPDQHYDTMTLSEIKSLPVGDLCGPHSLIWLWVPGCFVNVGEDVLNAWGAEFVTMGFWVKTQVHAPHLPKIGTGYVLRECGEPFLIGKIGKPWVNDRGIPSVIMEPRREHSRKPEQGYALAERMAPRGYDKLDLFSRQERQGWDCMGDEHDKFTNTARGCSQADREKSSATCQNGEGWPNQSKRNRNRKDEVQSGKSGDSQSEFAFC